MIALREACHARPFQARSKATSIARHTDMSVAASAIPLERRHVLALAPVIFGLSVSTASLEAAELAPEVAVAAASRADLSKDVPMSSLQGKDYGKSRLRYSDYTETPSGLQYKDLRDGTGETPAAGSRVVVDWDGYTIGYYGRPFEARNKPKGSSFNDDTKEFLRFTLGSNAVIPAFEEAVKTMKVGGVRRIIVPEEISYQGGSFKNQGPVPSTWAGERALDFVLSNRGMIDKTLLFDIELMRIDKN